MRRGRGRERAWTSEHRGVRRLIVLLGLTVGLNLVTVQPLPAVTLQFGSVGTLIVVRTYGLAWGMFAGLMGGLTAAWVFSNPMLLGVYLAEALVVALLLPYLDDNVALAGSGYWLLVGLPLTLALAVIFPPQTLLLPSVIALRLGMNGVLNAVIANVLLDHTLLWGARRKAPLRRHLFNLLVVLVLGTGSVLNIMGTRQEIAYLYDRHVEEVDLIEGRLGERLRGWTQGPARLLGLLGPQLDALEPEALAPRLESYLHLSEGVVGIFVADSEGQLVAGAAEARAADTLRGAEVLRRPLVRELLRDRREALLGVQVLSQVGEAPVVLYLHPVAPREGPEGVGVVAVDTEELGAILRQQVRGTGFRAVVVDPTRRVVASSDDRLPTAARFKPYEGVQERVQFRSFGLGRLNWPMSEARQTRAMYLGAPTHWTLHLDVSLAPLQGYLNRRLALALGVMLAMTVLVLPVAALVAASITRPLQRLAEGTSDLPRRLQEGAPVDWPSSRVEEIETLARNFDAMTHALLQRMGDMERADQAKDDFLATLGHELRNPLAPISSAIALLRRSGGDPRLLTKTLDVMERQSNHLARLVDDLLDLSRIARGKINLQEEVVDLRHPIRAAAQGVEPEVLRAGHSLTLSLPEREVWVRGDETRLEQIVSNLFTNAVKYTPPGGRIEVRLQADGRACLTVQDNGIGMEPEMLERVFEPFQQVARAGERGPGGLGVGLTLVRQLVGLHGGWVRARSEGLGTGTRMEVELPISRGPTGTDEPVEEPRGPVPRRRVLLVDDNADAAELMAELIRSWGHEVQTAGDGPEALERLKEAPADVVLLDIGLPSMSGHDVARAIRADPSVRQPLLVAITGFGQDKDREQSERAGFDAHLVKPVDLDRLEQLIGGEPEQVG